MKSYKKKTQDDQVKNTVDEAATQFASSQNEEDRLREAVYTSDIDKFRLFTRMLRTNALFKRAVVTHKKQ